jgi:hypothetical protein
VTTATLDIVPPHRLGPLLARARLDAGRSLDDVAGQVAFDADQVAAFEAGRLVLADDQLDRVLEAYQVDLSEVVPSRRQVVLDMESGELLVADESVVLEGPAPTAEDVLGAYLSLVYTLRRAEPGSRVVLRGYDVSVLARALHLAEPDVEARLARLMERPTPEVRRLSRLFRSKLVVPIVGAVVVATAVGAVLVLRSDDRPAEPTPSSQSIPPPELIPPQTLER